MKTWMFVAGVFLVAACSNKGPVVQWSKTQIASSVAACKTEVVARTDENTAVRMCTCYIDVVRSKYSYADYEKRAEEIDQELSNDPKIEACFN